MRIVHLTSVHSWNDSRIFLKMAKSLAASGYNVQMVVPRSDTGSVETRCGVTIYTVPLYRSRMERMWRTSREVWERAAECRGDIYHFHDPELLLQAVRFQKMLLKPVVYDAHEDLRLDVIEKPYLPRGSRYLMGKLCGLVEDFASNRLSAVVAATPSIAERFQSHLRCEIVQNFPLLGELSSPESMNDPPKRGWFAYVGGISKERGIIEMVKAAGMINQEPRLFLAGSWDSERLRAECMRIKCWNQVEEMGYLNRESVKKLLSQCQAGLVLFHPLKNHIAAQPNKMFEYMSAGLPVIASDFSLWRSIIGETRCGLLVNPMNPAEISNAMKWIIEHPQEAVQMGQRGQEAVMEKYNWDNEFKKLKRLYTDLAGSAGLSPG